MTDDNLVTQPYTRAKCPRCEEEVNLIVHACRPESPDYDMRCPLCSEPVHPLHLLVNQDGYQKVGDLDQVPDPGSTGGDA